MQDDLADMLEEANEVQEVMGRTYGVPEIDESELEAELDALGDDFALDEDTRSEITLSLDSFIFSCDSLSFATLSYLDEIAAPNAPDKEPGADSVATDKDGVLVDEFGLPKIPQQN